MRRLLPALLCFLVAVPVVAGAADPSSYGFLYGASENVKWTETPQGGGKGVNESGLLYGLGFEAKNASKSSPLFLMWKNEVFFGVLDYDGLAQSSTATYPAKSDSTYVMFNFEGGMGFHVGNEKARMAPYVGLGWKFWWRDIADSTFTDSTGREQEVSGVTEKWSMISAKAGVWGSARITRSSFVTIEGGMLFPLSTTNSLDLYGIEVEPEGQPSPYAEIGINMGMLRIAGYYETLRFDESSVVNGIYQPKSEMEVFGGKIGIAF